MVIGILVIPYNYNRTIFSTYLAKKAANYSLPGHVPTILQDNRLLPVRTYREHRNGYAD